jgi:hypothetical protein
MSLGTEKLGSSRVVRAYPAVSGNIDLSAVSGPCSQITIVGNGVLVIEDAYGEQVTLPDVGGGPYTWVVAASKIIASGTTASNIVVGW